MLVVIRPTLSRRLNTEGCWLLSPLFERAANLLHHETFTPLVAHTLVPQRSRRCCPNDCLCTFKIWALPILVALHALQWIYYVETPFASVISCVDPVHVARASRNLSGVGIRCRYTIWSYDFGNFNLVASGLTGEDPALSLYSLGLPTLAG
ncbi:hypothetical protein K474DRAFT_375483 [Panus rudis PR-1116 ss-1]|nr:hypothetical protein K474DRAFT_375483 [Panus rudis PR-1116 ss-1]